MKYLNKLKQAEWYKNRSFWITLIIAILLWIYINLNDDYITMIEVPLSVVPPTGRAIEQKINNYISVEFKGSGWNLFNYLYLNKNKRCYINLDNVTRDDSLYTIGSLDFQKGLEDINKIVPQRFHPNRIRITTGEIENKKVDVKSDVALKLKDGFILVGGVNTEPNTVTISGNSKSIEHINLWKTMPAEFKNINMSFNHTVDLSDSLASIIKVNPNKVKLYGEIQQYAEITFDDIELKVISGNLPDNHTISPTNFSVTLIGGVEHLNKISAKDIELTIDYNKIINDTVGILTPVLKIPPFTKIMDIKPKVIYHRIKIISNIL